MTKELEELVVDARLLAISSKTSESKLDSMLRRASIISGKLNCTREYQRDVEKLLVSNGKLDRRKGLLDELQKENRMIKSYEEENSMLRDQLEKSYATLDEIMSRHRQIMSRLHNDKSFCHLTPDMLEQISNSAFRCDVSMQNKQIEQAQRLMEVMRYCEMTAQKDNEIYAKVVSENRNLREMLNYASISDPNILAHFRKAMQEFDKDKKKKQHEEEEEEEEDDGSEEDSVLFNRTNQSFNSVCNTTVRKAKQKLQQTGSDDLSDQVDYLLTEIDELSEEGEAETILERKGTSAEIVNIKDSLVASLPPVKKEIDADSGTASSSSLSSSPTPSSLSE